MSLARRAKKRDSSEPAIIQALEQAGAEVWPIDKPVDLLVRFRMQWHLLEVKTPYGKKRKARIRAEQEEQNAFLAHTGTPVVTTPIEALRAIGAVA